MPLQRLICFRGDSLTIRQQCGHVQAFEGSTSGALLVHVGHRPAFLAGTPDHLALDVWHGLGVVVAPRLRLALPNRQTAHLQNYTVKQNELRLDCWETIYCTISLLFCTVLYCTLLFCAICAVLYVLYYTGLHCI